MKLGNIDIADIKIGSTPITKVMHGETIVWQIGGSSGSTEDWPEYYFTISTTQTIKKYDSDGVLLAESASVGWVPSLILADETYIYVGFSSSIKKYHIANLELIATGTQGGSPSFIRYEQKEFMQKFATQTKTHLFLNDSYGTITKIAKSNLARVWQYSIDESYSDDYQYFINLYIYSMSIDEATNQLMLFGCWVTDVYDLDWNHFYDDSYMEARIYALHDPGTSTPYDYQQMVTSQAYEPNNFYKFTLLEEDNACYYVFQELGDVNKFIVFSKTFNYIFMSDVSYPGSRYAASVNKTHLYFFRRTENYIPYNSFHKVNKDSFIMSTHSTFSPESSENNPYLPAPITSRGVRTLLQNKDYLFLTYKATGSTAKVYKYNKTFGYEGQTVSHGTELTNHIAGPIVNTKTIFSSQNKILMVGYKASGYSYVGGLPGVPSNVLNYGGAIVADATAVFIGSTTLTNGLRRFSLTDLTTSTHVNNISADPYQSSALILDGNFLYAFSGGHTLFKLNKSDLSIVATGTSRYPDRSLGACLIGDYIYAANKGVLYKYDKSTLSVIASISLGSSYFATIYPDPSDSQYIYALYGGCFLSKINVSTMSHAETTTNLSGKAAAEAVLLNSFSYQLFVDENYIYIGYKDAVYLYDKTSSHNLYKRIMIGGYVTKIKKIDNYLMVSFASNNRVSLSGGRRGSHLQIFDATNFKFIIQLDFATTTGHILLDFIKI